MSLTSRPSSGSVDYLLYRKPRRQRWGTMKNDKLLWKQRRGFRNMVTIMSGCGKTCWFINTPTPQADSLLLSLVSGRSSMKGASHFCERRSHLKSGCRVFFSCRVTRGGGFACRHGLIRTLLWRFIALKTHARPLKFLHLAVMIQLQPLDVSHSGEAMLNQWDQTPSTIKC